MRLSEDEKIGLWKEIQTKFDIFSLRTSMEPDYKIIVSPKDEGNWKVQRITINNDTEYDVLVEHPTGRIFIKIFKYSRNFHSSEAIETRFKSYILSAGPVIESYAQRGDLWLLFVKTPKEWNYLINPIFEEQRELAGHLLQRARRQKTNKFKEMDNVSELNLFLFSWIKRDVDKSLYGLLRYGLHN
ncbi:MAG: hypothetical protein ACP5NN_06770 [Methanolinea sp.]